MSSKWITIAAGMVILSLVAMGCAGEGEEASPLEVSSTLFHLEEAQVILGSSPQSASLAVLLEPDAPPSRMETLLETQFAEGTVAGLYGTGGEAWNRMDTGATPGIELSTHFDRLAEALLGEGVAGVDLEGFEGRLTELSAADSPEALVRAEEVLLRMQDALIEGVLDVADDLEAASEVIPTEGSLRITLGDLSLEFTEGRFGDLDTLLLEGEPVLSFDYDTDHRIVGVREAGGNTFGIVREYDRIVGVTDTLGHELTRPDVAGGYDLLGVNLGANFMLGVGIQNPRGARSGDAQDRGRGKARFPFVGLSAGVGLNLSLSLSALEERNFGDLVALSVYAPLSVWLGEERIDKGITKYFGVALSNDPKDRFANTHGLSVDLTKRLPGLSIDLTRTLFAPSVSKNDTASERDIAYTYTAVVKAMPLRNLR
ncbi:MAG: hypothetical protein D6795_02125 [Deltaproteobacteria bacterium]|nr:MAG: hypothetical protein D6795_02125 [Deltaproteobacteria bacterium]